MGIRAGRNAGSQFGAVEFSVIEFFDRLQKQESGCWEWIGFRYPNGYGQFGSNKYGTRYAHRVAWIIANHSQIPEGKFVCHRCDNPSCCNPDHLFLGTPEENSRDMVSKKRSALESRNGMCNNTEGFNQGQRNGSAKLTDEIALQVFNADGTQREIAERFGISQTHVGQIKRKVNWRHIHVDV